MTDSARLLANRRRVVAATWRRVRRAIAGEVASWWSDAERALVMGPPATTDAPLVAIAAELDDLVALQARFDDHARGDGDALDDLVGWFLEGEYVQRLMPRGRLPADPAPRLRALLDGMQDDLVARLTFQWALEAEEAPCPIGQVTLRPRFAPSWGHSPRHVLLGRQRAVLAGRTPLARTWRFAWSARTFSLSCPGVRIDGEWGGGGFRLRAPGREVQPVPRAGPWPLLPPIAERRPAPRPLFRDAPAQAERIEAARAVLAAAWPEGARTVDDFTTAIIPVMQPEVVSYSFFPVPGWSYINLHDRDFVDLVDDLVHENAHHHLNHILAGAPLLAAGATVDDDPGLLYYSPWRETLRPLRGILHSVFTFTAGAALFARLARALDEGTLPRRFSAAERRKIALRCLEETVQVRYSLVDLEHAWRAGRLTEHGHALVRSLTDAIDGCDALAPPLRRTIARTPAERRLARLEQLLDEKRALTRRATGSAR